MKPISQPDWVPTEHVTSSQGYDFIYGEGPEPPEANLVAGPVNDIFYPSDCDLKERLIINRERSESIVRLIPTIYDDLKENFSEVEKGAIMLVKKLMKLAFHNKIKSNWVVTAVSDVKSLNLWYPLYIDKVIYS